MQAPSPQTGFKMLLIHFQNKMKQHCSPPLFFLTINEQFLDSLMTVSLKRSDLIALCPSPPCIHPKDCGYLNIRNRQQAFSYTAQMDYT